MSEVTLTLGEAIARYAVDMRRRELSPDYIRVSESFLRQFVDEHGDRLLFAISRYDLRRHLRELARTRAASTMDKYKRVHRAFWAFCLEEGWIGEDISRPKEWPQPYQFVQEMPDEAPQLLCEAIAVYLDDMEARGLSEWHIRNVKSTLKAFDEVHGDRPLIEIGRRDLQDHFQALSKDRAEATLASMRSRHRAFWRYCLEEGWVDENIAAKLKRYSTKPAKSKAVPESHLQAVVDSLQPFVEHRDRDPRDVRDALFVSLSIDSGSRRGEMANLKRADVENELLARALFGERGKPIVYSVPSKGKTGAATVRFTEETAGLFRLWFRLVDEALPAGVGEGRVFLSTTTGEPLHINTFSKPFKRLCKFAGVPKFQSHAVRHRNITEIIDATGDPKVAQLVAGHSSLEITLDIYNETLERHALDATAQLAFTRRNGHNGNGKSDNLSETEKFSDLDPLERLAQLQSEMEQILVHLRNVSH